MKAFLVITFYIVFLSASLGLTQQLKPGQFAESIPNGLVKKGITQVGQLNLLNLQEKFKQVKWTTSSTPPHWSIADGYRKSGTYNFRKKLVTITDSPETFDLDVLRIYELHEALGALGYRDRNYSKSFALYKLEQTTDKIQIEALVKEFSLKAFNSKNLKVEGGSSVGGGGDRIGVEAKKKVLDYVESLYGPVSPQFFIDYTEINFDPDHIYENKNLDDIVFCNYSFFVKKAAKISVQESLHFIFPRKNWSDEMAKTKIIKLISQKILEIYPSSPIRGPKHLISNQCRDGGEMEFPESSDTRVNAIQRFKANSGFNCIKKDYLNKNNVFQVHWRIDENP